MKRIALIIALLLPLALHAKSDSTAAAIVDRYLSLLNVDALPHDSMLVITTTVTSPGSTDTFTMKRLYAWPQMFRVDVFDAGGKRLTGLCGNGTTRHRSYDTLRGWWRELTKETFYYKLSSFDFRGPLYNWRSQGVDLEYQGKTTVKGEQLDVVKVSGPTVYTRMYMFQDNGMLALIIDSDKVEADDAPYSDTHIEWKCIHEYQHIGETLLPSLESFARDNRLTVLQSEAHLEALETLQFNQD